MSAIIDFFSPQVLAVIGVVIVINIFSNIMRYLIVSWNYRQNEKELERVLQESEERMRVMMRGLEESRAHLLETLQKQKESAQTTGEGE